MHFSGEKAVKKNLFEAVDGCAEYLCQRNYLDAQGNMHDTCLNNTFDEVRKLLGKDFVKQFPNAFDARCWELLVARQIKKSSLKFQSGNVRVENEGGNEGKPDFKLTVEGSSAITIWLECVCPQKPKTEEYAALVASGDFEIDEEISSDETHISCVSSGIDNLIVTRFSGSLKDKSEAYERYIKNEIVEEKHYKILCVCGFSLRKYKAKRFCSDVSSLDTLADFNAAVQGDTRYFVQQNLPGIRSQARPLEILKSDSIICTGFQEHLRIFDAIVYFEESPADYLCREKSYRLYYGSKEAADVLAPYLSIIFPS